METQTLPPVPRRRRLGVYSLSPGTLFHSAMPGCCAHSFGDANIEQKSNVVRLLDCHRFLLSSYHACALLPALDG